MRRDEVVFILLSALGPVDALPMFCQLFRFSDRFHIRVAVDRVLVECERRRVPVRRIRDVIPSTFSCFQRKEVIAHEDQGQRPRWQHEQSESLGVMLTASLSAARTSSDRHMTIA
jgi:hypothetical protein